VTSVPPQDLTQADALLGGVDVDAIAAAVRAMPSVAGLHPGRFGEVTTYLPRRRVAGVRVSDQAVRVGVVIHFPTTAAEAGQAVRRAIAGHSADLTVEVMIADVVLPGDDVPAGHSETKES
jgi:hypothetical protein